MIMSHQFVLREKRRFCVFKGCTQSYAVTVSTTTLQKHTASHSKQPSLHASLAVQATKTLPTSLAVYFARANLPLHLTEVPAFKEMALALRSTNAAALPSRRKLTRNMMKEAKHYRELVIKQLKDWDEPVTVAIDGWTNVNHAKVTNMLLLAKGKSFFWKSIVNSAEHNTAKWLSEQFIPRLNAIRQIGIKFAGIALDNEATMNLFFDLLQQDFQFLLHIPCSAHIIQLVARTVLDHVTVKTHVAKMESILQEISSKKELRLSIRRAALTDNVDLVLIKPNATRWNSMRTAAIRFLLFKKYIAGHYTDDDEVDATFWQTLESVVVLLLPFQLATDDVQRDKATLMTFYNAFVTMKNSLRAIINSNGVLKVAAQAAIAALDDKWLRYADDKLETCIRYLLHGKNAVVAPELVSSSQRWLFSWAELYFEGMGIQFRSAGEDDSFEDTALVAAHLKTEFGKLKQEAVDGDIGWRTWWALNRERFPHLFHVAKALLSLAPTEAAVERSFSKQGLIHSDRRNRSSDALVEAQMMISFNHDNLFGSEAVDDPDEVQVLLNGNDAAHDEESDTEEEEKMDVEFQHGLLQTTVNQFFNSSSSSSTHGTSETDDHDAALARVLQEEELTDTTSSGRRVRRRL
jgi:Protein of unknown function (DUF 659)/hAT family C-terminal dimerisation region